MSITSALVLFAVVWFMVFFVVLPLRLRTQGDDGSIVPGTHSSAPSDPQIGRKAKLTTLWALAIWAVIAGVILSGLVTVRDIDVMGRMGPDPAADTDADTDAR